MLINNNYLIKNKKRKLHDRKGSIKVKWFSKKPEDVLSVRKVKKEIRKEIEERQRIDNEHNTKKVSCMFNQFMCE